MKCKCNELKLSSYSLLLSTICHSEWAATSVSLVKSTVEPRLSDLFGTKPMPDKRNCWICESTS